MDAVAGALEMKDEEAADKIAAVVRPVSLEGESLDPEPELGQAADEELLDEDEGNPAEGVAGEGSVDDPGRDRPRESTKDAAQVSVMS